MLPRRRGDGLERRVEMADVRRPEDDLGEQAGQRVRLHGDGPPLPVDGGAGHPAAATVEVDDDVAGRRVGVDRARHEIGRRGARQALERRQRGRWVRAGERIVAGHGPRIVPSPRGPVEPRPTVRVPSVGPAGAEMHDAERRRTDDGRPGR